MATPSRSRFLARAGQFTDTATDAAEQLELDAVPADPPEPIVAAGDGGDAGDDRWHAILVVEGIRTTDGREFADGALSMRPLPLPMMYLTERTYGHEGSVLGGQMDSIDRDADLAAQLAEAGFDSLAEGATLLVAAGGYADTDEGQEFRQLVNSQMLRFVSVDTEAIEYEYVWDGNSDPYEDAPSAVRFTKANVIGGTACPFPAFPQCVIAPASMSLFDAATQGMTEGAAPAARPSGPVAVAAAGGPTVPPGWWFENPDLSAPTPMTITSEGRVYGHAASWGTVHIGMQGRVTPPRSQSGYAYFMTGAVDVLDHDGSTTQLAAGQLTFHAGHAPTTGPGASTRATAAHYDNTATVFADVCCGEDEHGIWVAGGLRPGLSAEQERELRAASLSGDWRPIGRGHEMVACLAVNTPGFPIPRTTAGYARNNQGEEQLLALVAAGIVVNDPIGDHVRREVALQLESINALVEVLRPLAVAQLAARVRP